MFLSLSQNLSQKKKLKKIMKCYLLFSWLLVWSPNTIILLLMTSWASYRPIGAWLLSPCCIIQWYISPYYVFWFAISSETQGILWVTQGRTCLITTKGCLVCSCVWPLSVMDPHFVALSKGLCLFREQTFTFPSVEKCFDCGDLVSRLEAS
jgi:hypothetical protein